MTSFSAICPADQIAAANAALEGPEDARTGHGPSNFKQPVKGGTYAILHGWGNEAFYQKMLEIAPTYGIEVRDGRATEVIDGEETTVSESPVEQVKALAEKMTVQWPPDLEGNGHNNLPQKDEVRTFDGEDWIAQANDLVWGPSVDKVNWKRAEEPTGNEWQAGIAVSAGEEYTWGGKTYEVVTPHTTQDAWRPDKPGLAALWLEVAE